MVAGMESRKLEQLVLQLCCFAAITCCLHGEVGPQTTLHLKSSLHIGAVDRILLEVENRSESILSRRTRRIDPLDHFRKYEGGYNITNKHYWSSTIFTGRSGYLIAAIWFFVGIVFAGVLLVSKICFDKKKAGCNSMASCFERYNFWSVLVGVFLAVLAIAASAVALGGTVRFHSRAESIKEIIEATAVEATGTIYNITEAIAVMQNTSRLYGSSQGPDHLNSTVQTLNAEAAEIQTKAETNMRLVSKGIKILEVVTVVTVVVNLVAVFALLAGRPLRLHSAFCMFIIFCWLLTVLLWMYFGLYFFLDKFAGDTCIALDEYQLNPQNSTLGTIIPCSEQLSANVILHDVGAGIHDIIDQVNANIFTIKSQYRVSLDYVCNPFSGPPEYRYQPENCSSDTVKIGDIPQILKRLSCSDFRVGDCAPGEFTSAIDYNKVKTYTSSIQNVLDIFPGTERLVNCQLVKDGFSEILNNQCRPLRRNARMTWTALAILSTAMVLFILISTAGAFCDSRRHAIHHFVRHLCSSSSSEMSESDTTGLHSAKLKVRIGP